MKKIVVVLCLMFSALMFPQQGLQELIEVTKQNKAERRERILEYKAHHPQTFVKQEHRLLWDIKNGHPIYIENLNRNIETGIRTDFIKTNGALGLGLSGEGYTIGIWEVGGIPELLHEEFIDGNSISRIIQKDDSSIETFHATHVAGTLIAKGASLEAEGMANQAILHAYDAVDDNQEAIEALRRNELIISNHSYGIPVRNLEGNEWFMGAYSQEAKIWDDITNVFPYYAPVFAAGNDGNEIYEGGFLAGYDKLTGSINAKNTISVANASEISIGYRTGVFESALINGSSSQGPTDDGRIKPDITGLGTSIISTALENEYRTATGTSMASPGVAGSALLLQELHQNLYAEFMLSSTLKGLISVTADDAGTVGPDPLFGWGVMNSKRAAEAIIDKSNGDIIEERTLNENETYTLRVENNSGKVMKVGVAWNDPAGIAVSDTFNDLTPVLVNDLDIRVTNLATQEVYLPWKLNMESPSDPAQTGDNLVDNIEVIEIEEQGVFDIQITHKNQLKDGSQVYSLILLNAEEQLLSNESYESETIALWPNPVKNRLNITSPEISFSDDVRVSVYDMLGREVMNLSNFNSTSELGIDMSSLSKGIYILKLTDAVRSIQKRIIKE
ncbi:S8 family serine peptidase [Psychroflexus sp. YR1-1]|uniref:S8 family serine peptidase n=1 Tax=Psychroflexus aurantiacus TaxID=2709310 RepID=A0A6B3RB85_9FLAO|nr:S8 family serine peptidase [Psychroflexus aurantiacus]NEV94774.1 S8 family serine peptidase [Psychroflexus aurantiacus]